MKKKSVDFPKRLGTVTFGFNGHDVEVEQFISEDAERLLTLVYVEAYFGKYSPDAETDFTDAEWWLDYAILDELTSIDTSLKKWKTGNRNKIVEYSRESGLMNKIKNRIVNLDDLYTRICRVVSDGRQERFSANGLIKQLVASLGDMDFEKVKEMGKKITDIQDEVSDSPLGGFFDESKKG